MGAGYSTGNKLVIACVLLFVLVACETPGRSPILTSPEASLSPTSTMMPFVIASPLATPPLTPVASPTTLATATSQSVPLAISPLKIDKVDCYELLELEILTNIIPANPFDPEEFDIRVEFTSATGKTAEVGAFWYQGYDFSWRFPTGEPGWRARFTPTEVGDWTAVARIPSRGLESVPVSFRVVESGEPGFVRVHPYNPRYFAFDDGHFFFPIGLNMAWWSGAGDALNDYRKWMDPFSANGGNTIRVWMAEWSFGIEWNDTPLGDYENRLRKAWLLDQIFAMAEDRDMYILLVLLNCADFNNWQTNGWNGNPYNAARGGPLESPEQFVTDPTARTLLKKRLNYIVNRWGYSPYLLAWEWWNEVNLAPFTDETLIPWLKEMTAYLRERDVNHHLVTNSYAIRDLSPIWSLPEMDVIQKHEYAQQVSTMDKDLAGRVTSGFKKLAQSTSAKPVLLGEFGYGNEGFGTEVDKTGIHLHNGIWASTFAGYAGSGMYWWWDVYVENYNVWYHFRGLDRFLDGVDLSRYQPFSPLEINGPGGAPGQATGLGLRGEDILIWLRSDLYTVQAATAAWQAAGSPGRYFYAPPLVKNRVLTLQDIGDQEYTVRWFDPQSATWLDPVKVTAYEDQLSIPVPDFRHDLAARIIPNR